MTTFKDLKNKKVVIIEDDNWVGVFVHGKLVGQGHTLEECATSGPSNLAILELSEEFGFSLSDITSVRYENLEGVAQLPLQRFEDSLKSVFLEPTPKFRLGDKVIKTVRKPGEGGVVKDDGEGLITSVMGVCRHHKSVYTYEVQLKHTMYYTDGEDLRFDEGQRCTLPEQTP